MCDTRNHTLGALQNHADHFFPTRLWRRLVNALYPSVTTCKINGLRVCAICSIAMPKNEKSELFLRWRVLFDATVSEAHNAQGAAGHVFLVRDDQNRLPLLVEAVKNGQNFFACSRIQIAGGFIG